MIAQLLILAVILPIAYGPVGHSGLAGGGPQLLLIAVWLYSWLSDRKSALRFALLSGIAADLLGFHRFGLLSLELVLLSLVIDLLRSRFFNIASVFEAMLTLVVVTIINAIFQAILARQFDWSVLGLNILSNVVLGLILYYILGVWLRLFQRWRGQRL